MQYTIYYFSMIFYYSFFCFHILYIYIIKTKPPKKRLSKKEKERIRVDALAKIHKLKKDLGKAKFKKDIKKINSEIRKLNKLIK